EGGVRDVVADRALQSDLGAAVDLDVLDDVLVLLGQVLSQRLRRLIEVVVCIEQRKRDVDPMRKLPHGILPFLSRESYSHFWHAAISCWAHARMLCRTRNFCTLPLAVRG